MDRNTITGLVIIALILVGYSYFMSPSKEELREMHIQDSIARVEAQKQTALERQQKADFEFARQKDSSTLAQSSRIVFKQDSLIAEEFTLENDKIILHIDGKGGRINFVELKHYRTHDSLPLVLWKKQTSSFGLKFYACNQNINTENLIFTPSSQQKNLVANEQEQELRLRAYVKEDKYLEFVYKLAPDTYMVDFSINTYNLNDIIAQNTAFLTLCWKVEMPQLEKSKDFENRYTGVYYNFSDDDVEHLSPTSDEEADLPTKVKWIAYKQQFFSSVLIADHSFANVTVSSNVNNTPGYLKTVSSEISLPYSGQSVESNSMAFLFWFQFLPYIKRIL